MGTILSPIKTIENVRWTELKKGKITNVKRILKIADNGYLIELANGQYTVIGRHHTANGNYAIAGYGLDTFSQVVLRSLVRMGILKRKEVEEHIATTFERIKARDRKHDMRRLRELCEEHNIPVPEEAKE